MTLLFKTYSDFVDEIALYPVRGEAPYGAIYCALGAAGEAGEFADKIKKIWRDKEGLVSDEDREHLLRELGDILWYVSAAADELNSSLEEVAVINIEKLKARRAASTLQGEGDNR